MHTPTHLVLPELCFDLLDYAVLLYAGELLGRFEDVAVQLHHGQLVLPNRSGHALLAVCG